MAKRLTLTQGWNVEALVVPSCGKTIQVKTFNNRAQVHALQFGLLGNNFVEVQLGLLIAVELSVA